MTRLHTIVAGRLRPAAVYGSCLLAFLSGCGRAQVTPLRMAGPATEINRLLHERGLMTYAARTYSAPGVAEETTSIAGLVVMRRPADLRSLGGPYYGDDYGNLIRTGFFTSPTLGGASRYALTFRRNGGVQLALDFRNDAVVDVLVELDRDGRVHALADPLVDWFVDCLSEHVGTGANLVEAANQCLEEAGGGGGGLGPAAARDVSRLAEPDCREEGGIPGSVQQEAGSQSTTKIEMENGDVITATESVNEDGTTTTVTEIRTKQGDLVYRLTTLEDPAGNVVHSKAETWTATPTGWTYTRTRDGVVEKHEETSVQIGGAVIETGGGAGGPGTGSTRQPVPECEDCPVDDPRCAPAPNDIASLWDCVAETDRSLDECLRRMRDVIYAGTNGRCASEPGPADQPVIRCNDRRLAECIDAGRSLDECLREAGFRADDTDGPENDDFLRDRFGRSRGRVGFYIDTTPMGGVLAGFCAHGVEQLCRGDGRF